MPKHSIFRFRLRRLILFVVAACILMAWLVYRVEKQKSAIEWIESKGGRVFFEGQVHFDEHGNALVESELQTGVPTILVNTLGVNWFHNVEYVELQNANIESIDRIVTFRNLRVLRIEHSNVKDISTLRSLESLEYLDLDGVPVSDFSPLSNLLSLRYLNLNDTDFSDVRLLTQLSQLETLNLKGTKVDNVRQLVNLKELKSIDLSNTNVDKDDIEFLSEEFEFSDIGY